jgi:hypothetical protein
MPGAARCVAEAVETPVRSGLLADRSPRPRGRESEPTSSSLPQCASCDGAVEGACGALRARFREGIVEARAGLALHLPAENYRPAENESGG